MDRSEKKNENKLIVDAVFDLIYESEPKSDLDIDKSLKEQGLDPNQLEAKGLKFLRELRREQRFAAASKKRALFDLLKQKLFAARIGTERRGVIKQLLEPIDSSAQLVFNRKLDSITDSYLETLETDTALLELWQNFQNDIEDHKA